MVDVLGPANAFGAVTSRPDEDRIFGALDTWLRDCTSIEADDGTDIRAAFLNGILANARALWRMNGNLLDGSAPVNSETVDLDNGLARAVRFLVQRGKPSFALDTGSTNALAVTLVPAPPELNQGMVIRARVANDNTGAATINVNGLGAKSIVRPDGVALRARDLIAGAVVVLIYDGSKFQLSTAQVSALTAPRTYYCSPSGNDNNNGMTEATPFRQITHALDVASLFNQNGFNVRIEADDGSYNPLTLGVPNGSGTIEIAGNDANPSSCQIAAITGPAVRATASRGFLLHGFKLSSAARTPTTPGSGIWAAANSFLSIANIDWGNCADHHMTNSGSQIDMSGNMIISGNALAHAYGGDGCKYLVNAPNNPALIIPAAVAIEAFLNLSVLGSSGLIYSAITGAGNVTGKKYLATGNSVIQTNGSGASYYPGTIAGETQSGGQYL